MAAWIQRVRAMALCMSGYLVCGLGARGGSGETASARSGVVNMDAAGRPEVPWRRADCACRVRLARGQRRRCTGTAGSGPTRPCGSSAGRVRTPSRSTTSRRQPIRRCRRSDPGPVPGTAPGGWRTPCWPAATGPARTASAAPAGASSRGSCSGDCSDSRIRRRAASVSGSTGCSVSGGSSSPPGAGVINTSSRGRIRLRAAPDGRGLGKSAFTVFTRRCR